MRKINFSIKDKEERILLALEMLGVERTEELTKAVKGMKRKCYSEVNNLKGLSGFSNKLLRGVKDIVIEENKMKYKFTLNTFEDWLEEYYFDNFYKGKYFGLKGIGLNIYTCPLIYRDIMGTFSLHKARELDCVKVCKQVFDRIPGKGLELLNKETLLEEAETYTFCLVKYLEADSWTYDEKTWLRCMFNYTQYNNCVLFLPFIHHEFSVDKKAMEILFANNIDVTIKE